MLEHGLNFLLGHDRAPHSVWPSSSTASGSISNHCSTIFTISACSSLAAPKTGVWLSSSAGSGLTSNCARNLFTPHSGSCPIWPVVASGVGPFLFGVLGLMQLSSNSNFTTPSCPSSRSRRAVSRHICLQY